MDINNCVFSGRLTKDAVQKTIPTGSTVVNFSIACNTKSGTKERVLYVECTAWEALGKSLKQYLVKGKNVCVIGELECQVWQTDGVEHKKNVLTCRSIVLLNDGKRNDTAVDKDEYPSLDTYNDLDNI